MAESVAFEVQEFQCLVLLVIFQAVVTMPGAQIAARTFAVVLALGKNRDGD